MQLSIRWKLIISIVLPLVTISIIVMLLTFDILYSNANEQLHNNATDIARNYAARLDGQFQIVAQVARSTANFLELHSDLDEQELYEILHQNVLQNPLIYGAAIAFDPYEFRADKKLFSPYVYRNNSELISIDVGVESYDYTSEEWEWFSRPRKLKQAIWTEPYFDKGAGNILMTTYSVPFYGNGEFRGVVTVDIPLLTLQQQAGIKNLEEQAFVIISPSGKFISHPDPNLIMQVNVRDRAAQLNDSGFSKIVEDILNGKNGVGVIKAGIIDIIDSGSIWIFYAPIKSTGWSFSTAVPESKMTKHVRKQLLLAAVSLFILVFLLICSIMLVSNNLTAPIRRLAIAVKRIREGELDSKVSDIKSSDELGQLATGFNDMVDRLNIHVDALSKEMAARQLVENELSVAREIQTSLLPGNFPEHEQFDLHARNEAARHVSGDFYDFFFVEENTLMIIMADVSGKALPAAIVRAITRTIIRNLAKSDMSPSQILEETNRLLIDGRTPSVFVTIFLGCYDIISGTLSYSNAGHHPAYIVDERGEVKSSGGASGTIVGMLDDALYENNCIILEPNNYLVLYTDGIPEARSAEKQFFGDENFKKLLSESVGRTTQEICDDIIERVTEYQAGELSDDITLLILHRN